MSTVAGQRFPRSMRLKRRRLIAPLFKRENTTTKSLTTGCIRILYRFVPRETTGVDSPIQVGFAPGRCKNAVERNRLKRKMRELWRRNQHIVNLQSLSPTLSLTLMVLASKHSRTRDLANDFIQGMHLLHQSINKG